jgi:hypothetical protein
LHQASCRTCATKINSEIESPALRFMWLDARTHLGLPTSSAPTHLKVGVWDSSEPGLPKNMDHVNFQFRRVTVDDHPFRLMQAQLDPPGIFSNLQPSENFQLCGMEVHVGGGSEPDPGDGKKTGYFQPFSPDIVCRMVAKIAHGAAVAELGLAGFDPFLPDLIMGRSKFLSHYVGSSHRRGRKSQNLHEISLELDRGFVVANVGLFSIFGFRSYQAVVGTPSEDLAKWYMSSSKLTKYL